MRIEIKRLHRRMDVTSIYVTHDQTEAMTLADRLAVINDGRIEQMGAPLELYNNPTTLFVASFIGSPQINLMPAIFDGKNLVSGDISLAGFKDLPLDVDLALGLRPDDLKEHAKGELSMRVDLVEQHGAENLIYGGLLGAAADEGDETEICFKVDQQVLPKIDSIMTLALDRSRALVFRKDTGQRVL
jgi:sn-glycerol 3-phosphate transport system ATP-binding protein